MTFRDLLKELQTLDDARLDQSAMFIEPNDAARLFPVALGSWASGEDYTDEDGTVLKAGADVFVAL